MLNLNTLLKEKNDRYSFKGEKKKDLSFVKLEMNLHLKKVYLFHHFIYRI